MRLTGRDPAERGSVLMLVPAGFLVLVTLAALAVDSAATYLAQQQLHDSLVAAANDAVTAGLSNQSFYARGAVTIDRRTAGQVVCLSVAAQSDHNLHEVQLWMAVSSTAIRLRGTAVADAVFGRAIPGFGRRHVKAEAQAVVTGRPLAGSNDSTSRGPLGPLGPPGPLVPLTCP